VVRTTLITGASSGIGAETAFLFGSKGAHTLVHYAGNAQGASDVVEKIRGNGGSANLVSADLSTLPGIQQFTETIQSLQKPIDILVNNAGSLVQRKPFLDISERLWSEVFALNLTSAFLITQAVLPSMVQRRRGWIVNVKLAR
jgi:3-oxoacyl-[acyl-carrier protein] reductase